MAPTYERFTQLEAAAQAAGLTEEAAWRYALLAWWGEHFGAPAPRIVSGRRSEARQRELRERWDRGDRAGLVTRPALYSNHTRGTAWDVERGRGLDMMARLAPYAGVRWGGDFATPDPVHFDLGES